MTDRKTDAQEHARPADEHARPAPALSPAERQALHDAVELAGRGAGTVLPNPVVGCVLLDQAERQVGAGYHQRAGEAHAEVLALQEAGAAARGGTAVVTLEPCDHHGRTPPCSQALLAAGVRRVVVAVRDPTPQASGGIARLRAAGVQVVDLTHTQHSMPAREVNRVWLTAVSAGRPYVTVKAGMSIDGRVAAADGTSRWITSPESRADVHVLRGSVDTIMAGSGTVLADDPELTVRGPDGAPTGRQPLRVVVDSTGRIPPTATVFNDNAETFVATVAEFPGRHGRVDLAALLAQLFARGRRHLLVEGGPRLVAALLDAGLVDELVTYVAPMVIGRGPSVVEQSAAATLADARPLSLVDVQRFGPDVRLRYRPVPPV